MPGTIIVAQSVSELASLLQFGNPCWKGASLGQVAFRGQADGRWGLVPSAFRQGRILGYAVGSPKAPLCDIARQSEAEYRAVRSFVDLADSVGLEVPGDMYGFRLLGDMAGAAAHTYWREKWPEPSQLEILAIAQHHGVPTRLLDFTYRPFVALFFAASDALERAASHDRTERFAVWALDLRFIREVWSRTPRYPERIKEIVVPRFGNHFLQAQDGFFLVDIGVNKHWPNGVKALETVVEERVSYWSGQLGAWPSGSPSAQYFLPWIKIEVECSIALDVLRYLHREGVHQAAIMPSHRSVVQALDLFQTRGFPVTG